MEAPWASTLLRTGIPEPAQEGPGAGSSPKLSEGCSCLEAPDGLSGWEWVDGCEVRPLKQKEIHTSCQAARRGGAPWSALHCWVVILFFGLLSLFGEL